MQTTQARQWRELLILSSIFVISPLIDNWLSPAVASGDPTWLQGSIIARLGGLWLCLELLSRYQSERLLLKQALRCNMPTIFWGMAGAIGLWLLAAGLSATINATGLGNDNSFLAKLQTSRLSSFHFFLLAVSVVVAAGFEEMFWRVFWIERWASLGLPTGISLAAGSLLFATNHLYQGWIGFAVSGLLGLVLGILWLWRRNYWLISLAHGGYNLFIIITIQMATTIQL